jgi:hypothetical protein
VSEVLIRHLGDRTGPDDYEWFRFHARFAGP